MDTFFGHTETQVDALTSCGMQVSKEGRLGFKASEQVLPLGREANCPPP